MAAKRITVQGFLSEFVRQDKNMPDRPFCWILGSGASRSSGIPTGGELAIDWLKDLHELEDHQKLPLEKWATEQKLDIPGFKFENAASFYPWIYWRRYRDDKEAGYAFLEKIMVGVEPKFGYLVLAQILASSGHNVVITPNFDNLIANAMSICTDVLPLVCGHELLTGYIRNNLRRPLVAKIHRDLLLKPLSEPGKIGKLSKGWNRVLKHILKSYTPIVIGYGGNDGSLMGFLRDQKSLTGGVYWCYLVGTEPAKEICDVVEKHQGKLVPISGFDELMLELWIKLKLKSPIYLAKTAHEKRVREIQNQFEALNDKLKKPAENKVAEAARAPVREAAAAAVKRLTKENDWWAWQLKIKTVRSRRKKEEIYREGLKALPKSSDLIGNFALFLEGDPKRNKEIESLYRKALKIDPKNARVTANFAYFMYDTLYNNDEAEILYRKALELDPNDADITAYFAFFMHHALKNVAEAERLYRRALELNPKYALNIVNFADFTANELKSFAEADFLYRRARFLDPSNKYIKKRYAEFLQEHQEFANRLTFV